MLSDDSVHDLNGLHKKKVKYLRVGGAIKANGMCGHVMGVKW